MPSQYPLNVSLPKIMNEIKNTIKNTKAMNAKYGKIHSKPFKMPENFARNR